MKLREIWNDNGGRMGVICIVAALIALVVVESVYAEVPVKKAQPVTTSNGWVCRTKQQDLELRDWIAGIQREARVAIEQAAKAKASEAKVKEQLALAAPAATELKTERDDAVIREAAIKKKLFRANCIFIGVWLAFLAVVYLKFPLPGPLKAYALYVFIPVALLGIGAIWKWL